MRTVGNHKNIASALFGQVRRAILALLFTHSAESFYVRQIARIAGGGLGAVHRELNNLVQADLVVRTNQGKQVYYQANSRSPVFDEIRGMIVKTVGVVDVLRVALAPLAERINVAFVYGSIAHGTERSESDVDLMIIGEVTFGEVVQLLHSTEIQLRREVNPSVFSVAEFCERAQSGEHFIASVLEDAKLLLIGDENELGRLAARGQA